jgi:NADH-quinone oxidoreductase subunit K
MHPVIAYLIAAGLFGLGVFGVLTRRNAVLLLMAVELLLNAVNLVLVTADATVRAALPASGQVFALFVIVLAAAEVGVGLALILALYRRQASIAVDEVELAEPAEQTESTDPTDDPTEPTDPTDEPTELAEVTE